MIGDGDCLGLVFHHEDGVPLVPQLKQQLVHPLDVVGVETDGRFVKDVGDIGERRPEVADHLGALRLAARQRTGGAVEREVAEADLHERLEGVQQLHQKGCYRRFVEASHPIGEVADLHRTRVGDADPRNL